MPKEKPIFTCVKCSAMFSSLCKLNAHIDSKCGTVKLKCKDCDAQLSSVYSLKQHVATIHSENSKLWHCAYCSTSFHSKGQLVVHERKHTQEKAFICPVCQKGFKHRESLVTHSTIHSGIKPWVCECCNSRFSCIGNLVKHRRVRPETCGLPIYTNKRTHKRAGIKLKGKTIPSVIIGGSVAFDQKTKEEPSLDIEEYIVSYENPEEQLSEEADIIDYEPDPIETSDQYDYGDHQYVAGENGDQGLEDKKAMDVFEYINYEIRNIEQEEMEQKQQHEVSIESYPKQAENMSDEVNSEMYEEVFVSEEQLDENCMIEEIEHNENIINGDDELFEIVRQNDTDIDEELKNFIDLNHNDESFRCKLCPKIYQKLNITVKHLKSCHNIVFENYNYDDRNRYRKAQRPADFKCTFCPRRYTSRKLVDKHEEIHGENGNLIHKCPCCIVWLETYAELLKHQDELHLDRIQCDSIECMKKFDHPDKLASHKKYAHLKRKVLRKYNYVCESCGRNFGTKVSLHDHERANCGKNPIYACEFCHQNYHSAGSLKVHMTVHTQELPFECEFDDCAMKFRTKGQLTIHRRRHTKEKPFKCPEKNCSAEFAHRESLKTHASIHKGRKWECKKCFSKFSCLSNLLAHQKRRKNCLKFDIDLEIETNN